MSSPVSSANRSPVSGSADNVENELKNAGRINEVAREAIECSICLSEIDKGSGILTNCGHTFHRPCLSTWAEEQAGLSECKCPNCRESIKNLLPNLYRPAEMSVMNLLRQAAFSANPAINPFTEEVARRIDWSPQQLAGVTLLMIAFLVHCLYMEFFNQDNKS